MNSSVSDNALLGRAGLAPATTVAETPLQDLGPSIPGTALPGSHFMEGGVDRFARGAHSGIDAASDAARPAIDRMASSAHHAVDHADVAARHAAEALERVGVRGEQLVATGTGYLREHPVLTLGLAVATGYLLSRVLDTR